MEQQKTRAIKRKTIVHDLIVGLIFSLVVIVTIVGVGYYFWESGNAERKLQIQAEEMAGEFSHNIALPLFNYEVETARHIAKASLQADLLAGITVTQDNAVLFEKLPETMNGVFAKDFDVVWSDEVVGGAKLYFTRKKLDKDLFVQVKFAVLVLLCVTLTCTIATRFILKRFLTIPLQRLTEGMHHFAAGNYDSLLEPAAHSDINAIVMEFNRMGKQVIARTDQLIKSERNYRSIFENAVEGMFKSTADGLFVDANPAMALILGYESRDELVSSITDIKNQLYVHPGQRAKFLGELESKGMVQGLEIEFFRKDGSHIWVYVNSRAIYDTAGKIIEIVGFVVDISRRIQMENELRKAHNALEGRVRERTQDLEEKTAKLERANKLFVDRELRMKELKKEIQGLKDKLGESADSK